MIFISERVETEGHNIFFIHETLDGSHLTTVLFSLLFVTELFNTGGGEGTCTDGGGGGGATGGEVSVIDEFTILLCEEFTAE